MFKFSHFKGPGEVLEFQNSIWEALLSLKMVLDLNLEGKWAFEEVEMGKKIAFLDRKKGV